MCARRHLIEDSRLCDVISSDGSRFRVRSCIRGHLLELNERLKLEPGLLNDKTTTEGYIAIVNPRRDDEDTVCDAFLSKEQYMSRLADMAATDDAKKICNE